MKVLITGATGFIGRSLVDALKSKHQLIVIESSTLVSFTGVKVVKCQMENYSELPSLITDRDIDVCIHLAWAGNSGPKRADYQLQMDNVLGTLNLIDSLHIMKVNKVVVSGTIAEKDVLSYHLMNGSKPNPVSTYAVCKLTAHLLSKIKCNEYGMEHIWACIGNTYGPGNNTGNFINFMISLMTSDKRLSFTDGTQLYDFVYIDDVIGALTILIEKGSPNEEYYIGSGKPRQLRDYIEEAHELICPEKQLYLGEVPYRGKALTIKDYSISSLKKYLFKSPAHVLNLVFFFV